MPDSLDTTSLLLLYVAGEASPSQRAVIEQNLKRDAAWREQLEAVRATQAQVNADVAELDGREPLPVSEGVALRRAARAMQQWQVDRLLRPVGPAAPRRAKFGWTYAIATAAAVLVIGVFVLWSRVDDTRLSAPIAQNPYSEEPDSGTGPTTQPAPLPNSNPNTRPPTPTSTPTPDQNLAQNGNGNGNSTDPDATAIANALAEFGGGGGDFNSDNADSLTRAEQQVANLTTLTENSGEREEAVPQ